MLEVDGLTVRCGKLTILDGVTVSVRAGQWLMVVGPNGAGKSTLVNAVAQGVSYEGSIRFDGQDMSGMKPAARARSVGLLAQTHYVGYSYSVEEIVRLGRYAHMPGIFARGRKGGAGFGSNDDAAVGEALALTGMAELRSQPAPTLSGGELQRAFLAQALAQDPALLMLDEPTSHLDLIYQKQTFELIQKWLRAKRRAVISVVHDVSLARMFGMDALLLDKGRAVAQGPIHESLCVENLDRVYGMDVHSWMCGMLSQWAR